MNAKDEDGETPLLRARSRGDKDIEKLLKKHGAKAVGGLVRLASSGEAITAKALKAALAEGDQLDAADGEGLTALHHAAKKGLLAKGADVSLTNALGQTVADKARWGSAEVKRALGIAEAERGFGSYGGHSGSEGDSDNDDG